MIRQIIAMNSLQTFNKNLTLDDLYEKISEILKQQKENRKIGATKSDKIKIMVSEF